MRRFVSVVLAAIALGVAALLLLVALPASASAEPDQGSRGESPCSPLYDKTASPNVILLGETVELSLHFAAVCAAETFPLHIVLVLDASGSMAGGPNRDMQEAARSMVQSLRMDENPGTRVGVVKFNLQAQTLCQLYNDPGRVMSCISHVDAAGGTRIDLGILEGTKVLLQGRGDADKDTLREVMVVLSDGDNGTGCADVLSASRKAQAQGILVIAICVGPACDIDCMRQAASKPRYFFTTQNSRGLKQVFDQITDEIQRIYLRRLQIRDILPPNMVFVPGSASHAGAWDPSQRSLTWDTAHVPSEGMTVTFQVRPADLGYWPTNVEAEGVFLDSKSREGRRSFNVPFVTVLLADAQPTPGGTMPPPPLPTPTDEPQPTPTATPTPTRAPAPVYLPVALHLRCTDHEVHADIALVLDLSTSMRRATRDGRPKIEAILEASRAFASSVDMIPNEHGEHSQLAVLGFNSRAWVEIGLTSDLGAVHGAIARLPNGMAEHTRLDLALTAGRDVLSDGRLRKVGNTPVLVLLTDGLPNQVPYSPDGSAETTVLRAADAAKAAGIQLYTIGVGQPGASDPAEMINPGLLTSIASRPENYFETSDAEEVLGIYRELKLIRRCVRLGGWEVGLDPGG